MNDNQLQCGELISAGKLYELYYKQPYVGQPKTLAIYADNIEIADPPIGKLSYDEFIIILDVIDFDFQCLSRFGIGWACI